MHKTVEQIVQQNLDFYNQRDIDGFMSCLSDSIQLFNFGDSDPSMSGESTVRDFYRTLFSNSPDLHSQILKRIVIGNKVIDHESIVGRNGEPDSMELVLIYEVEEQKITRITVLRSDVAEGN